MFLSGDGPPSISMVTKKVVNAAKRVRLIPIRQPRCERTAGCEDSQVRKQLGAKAASAVFGTTP